MEGVVELLSSPQGLLGLLVSAACVLLAGFFLFRKRGDEAEIHTQDDVGGEVKAVADKSKKGNARKIVPVTSEKHHASHPLCLNTIKGHQDVITGLAFTLSGKPALATACADRVVRVFKLEDCSAKSFKFLRINLPLGSCPTGVAFGEGDSQLVIAADEAGSAYVCMYGAGRAGTDATKLPPPEMKWERKPAHDGGKSMITLMSTEATFGGREGSVVAVSCSEGTDIKVWTAADGKCVGHVDTNQLQNHMAALSPDGHFLAAAAFTADVKIWEVKYSKDGAATDVVKCMQLKGHKSAVTWLSFSADSKLIVTASKDGTIKFWNINVRYHLQEDPKCIWTFPIPLPQVGKHPPHYDRIALSPDGRVVVATFGGHLQWLDAETGEVLDEAQTAHEGLITCLLWAPGELPTGHGRKEMVLATASSDKKVKLWLAPGRS